MSADVLSEHPDLAQFVANPDAAALLLDFDGTLAPIVDNPENARPLPAAVSALDLIRRNLRDVVIVSGRPLDFLRPLVPPGIDLAGLDGLQRSIGGVVVQDPRVKAFGMVVEQVAGEAERLLPGVLVERKSNISVSLHWRTNPAMGENVVEVAGELAERHGLHLRPGRMVLELR
ncbi:MAG TPA: trehalose-phosphatase, partial [Actinomycetota bacterium]|nr:trehalose-phosphatase [Actinomycetota bacterium]